MGAVAPRGPSRRLPGPQARRLALREAALPASDAQFWMRHSNGAYVRAFWRGVDAASAGLGPGSNPYRDPARRRGWSEAHISAWASGHRHQTARAAARARAQAARTGRETDGRGD